MSKTAISKVVSVKEGSIFMAVSVLPGLNPYQVFGQVAHNLWLTARFEDLRMLLQLKASGPSHRMD